jgi:hypothetical protein
MTRQTDIAPAASLMSDEVLVPKHAADHRLGAARTRGAVQSLWAAVRATLAEWRRHRTAAALYARLSRLSDAELQRRGIRRSDLHRIVSDAAGIE